MFAAAAKLKHPNRRKNILHSLKLFTQHSRRRKCQYLDSSSQCEFEVTEMAAATLPAQQIHMPSSSAAGIIALLDEDNDNLKVLHLLGVI